MTPSLFPGGHPTGLQPDLEQRLEAFEEAWQSAPPPRLDDFLASDSPDDPFRRHLLEELIKIDLEYRWRRPDGEGQSPVLSARPLLNDYLRRFPELGALEQVSLGLIVEEYRVRQWWGDRPGQEEYVARFSSHGAALQEALQRIDRQIEEESARRKKQPRPPSAAASPAPAAAIPLAISEVPIPVLVEAIRRCQLLGPPECDELVHRLQHQAADARALARELLQRDWLTAYQVNHLLKGLESELVLGPYVLLQRLGEGGTGSVFKARHQHMKRLVALKVLRHELLTDPAVVARFYREIQVISQLSHPHVIHPYDAGPIGPEHVLVMEYAEGVDLSLLVKRSGPLPVLQACEHIRQAALGLQHIHERGQFHRDIKPANLLLTQAHGSQSLGFGLVKILDLGLARLGKVDVEPDLRGRVHLPGGSSARLTPQGAMVVGTPDYLAPEQAADFHQADGRADIYSLGCTLFYLLAGRPPFPGGNLVSKLLRHQSEETPDIRQLRPEVPDEVESILRRMLAKEPEQRYQTAGEMVRVLSSFLGRPPALETQPALTLPPPEIVTAAAVPPLPVAALAPAGDSSPSLQPANPEPPRGTGRKPPPRAMIALALLTFGVLGTLVFWSASRGERNKDTARGPTLAGPAVRTYGNPVPIPTLFSTGLAEDGQVLSDGAVDPHWLLTSTPTGPPPKTVTYVTNNLGFPLSPGPWLPNTRASRWISPQADERVGDLPGPYTYKTTFDLSGFDPATTKIIALVVVDNLVSDVLLNGRSLRLTAPGYDAFTQMKITGPFAVGVNTLEFLVINGDVAPNPSGLRVEFTGVARPMIVSSYP